MKRIYGFLILAMLVLCTVAFSSCGDDDEVSPNNENGEVTPEETDNTPDGVEAVDLGLPSGTLWATCNIGASSPEEYGDYFAWGETVGYLGGKTDFSWSTYKWSDGDSDWLTKYCYDNYHGFKDNKRELDLEDDAAYVNRGKQWRMPSREQFEELINSYYTTTESTTRNGVSGLKITSKKNGKSIFMPAAGSRGCKWLVGASVCCYWSLNVLSGWSVIYPFDPSRAWCLVCFSTDSDGSFGTDYLYRYYGLSVRPVRLSQN